MRCLECLIFPESIFAIFLKARELTHLVGVFTETWLQIFFFATSFCFSVKMQPAMCQKMCAKSHADLDTSRGSYFYHTGEENRKWQLAGKPRQGWVGRGRHACLSCLARLAWGLWCGRLLAGRARSSGVEDLHRGGCWHNLHVWWSFELCGFLIGPCWKRSPLHRSCSLTNSCVGPGGENGGQHSGKLHKYENQMARCL